MILNLAIEENIDRTQLFGPADRHLKLLRDTLGVHLSARGVPPPIMSGSRRAVWTSRGTLWTCIVLQDHAKGGKPTEVDE